MTTPSELIKIDVFRPLDGLRAPYTITLDRTRNVVSDELNTPELERIKANPYLLARHQIEKGPDTVIKSHTELLEHQGLHRHITDQGITISREPPSEWEINFDIWLDQDSPNPFDGSGELREEYFAERADVARRIADGNCPGCEMNRLQVVYRNRLRDILKL